MRKTQSANFLHVPSLLMVRGCRVPDAVLATAQPRIRIRIRIVSCSLPSLEPFS